jgi:hypothetical protein
MKLYMHPVSTASRPVRLLIAEMASNVMRRLSIFLKAPTARRRMRRSIQIAWCQC